MRWLRTGKPRYQTAASRNARIKTRSIVRTLCFSGLAICLVSMSWTTMKPYPGKAEIIQQRQLLATDDEVDDDCLALYPNMTTALLEDFKCSKTDEMCKEPCCASGASATQFFELEPFGGMFFLHIFIMFYMFQGIAIVCDEQFVPALEVIAERLQLSNDIAGATLMAAGGSAPELATNTIASIFSGSDVGFGAIVGSAVFNVLFVIGVCAIATPKHLLPLQLTWWPLFRDCTYYIISLLALFIFFRVVSPWKVYAWEAVVQFVLYLGYVLLMAYSETLEAKVKKYFEKNKSAVIDVKPAAEEEPDTNVEFERPSTFRVGILELLEKGTSSLAEKASYAAIAKIQGDADATFDKIDSNKSGTIEQDELKEFVMSFTSVSSSELDSTAVMNLCKELASQSEGDTISRDDFKKWYMTSEDRMTNEVKKTFDKVDRNNSGFISKGAIKEMLEGLGHKADDLQIEEAEKLIKGSGEEISFEDFQKWYKSSLFWNKKTAIAEAAADDEESSSMWEAVKEGCAGLTDKEKGAWEKFMFIFNLPLMTVLSVLPNCQAEGMGGWSYFVFFGSIVYIGIFCALMVDSAVVIGYMLCIPDVVMGMVFLAAGTSVPDLISSVIVAKQGEGDMAVSSSVGSNIFDVCFGLPVPWLLMNLVYGNCGVTVTAKNLPLSLGLLLAMVFVVVVAIGVSGWKMSHELGYFFFACYFIYLLQDIIQVFTLYADDLAPSNPQC